MLQIILLCTFITVSVAVFNLLANVLEVPHKPTIKAMLITKEMNTPKNQRYEIIKQNLAHFLSRFIKINEFKREEMFEKLNCSQIIMTPEEYMACSMVKPLIIGTVAIVILLLGQVFGIISGVIKLFISICGFALIVIAILMYFRELQMLDEGLKEKRKEIELELPRFVSIISKAVKRDKNVLNHLERYLETAGRHFKDELKITIADMKSGNQETALLRMESRISSSALSDIVRGLIAVLQGNDTDSYWENLEIRLSEAARQTLEAEALKVPDKIKKLTVALVACFVGTYFIIFGMYIAQSLADFA